METPQRQRQADPVTPPRLGRVQRFPIEELAVGSPGSTVSAGGRSAEGGLDQANQRILDMLSLGAHALQQNTPEALETLDEPPRTPRREDRPEAVVPHGLLAQLERANQRIVDMLSLGAHALQQNTPEAAAELLDMVAKALAPGDVVSFAELCRAAGRGPLDTAALERALLLSDEFQLRSGAPGELFVAWADPKDLWQRAFRRALLEILGFGSAEPETLSQLCGRVLKYGPHPKWGYLLKCVGPRIFHPHHAGKGEDRKLYLRLRRDASVEDIAVFFGKLDAAAAEMATIHLDGRME